MYSNKLGSYIIITYAHTCYSPFLFPSEYNTPHWFYYQVVSSTDLHVLSPSLFILSLLSLPGMYYTSTSIH